MIGTMINTAEHAVVVNRAAMATPIATASVTQSSTHVSASNTTTENGVRTTVTGVDADGDLQFTIANSGAGWNVNQDDIIDEFETDGSFIGAELRKSETINGQPGTLYVDAYTDYDTDITGGDTDYLAGGFWVFVPADATTTDHFGVGAFVSGGDPFADANVDGLAGTATYIGGVAGLATDRARTAGSGGVVEFFDGDVNLTANFDTNRISGTVSGIETDDGESYDEEIMLGETTITPADSGFFQGSTSVDGLTGSSGSWGGQFFGNDNGNPNSDHPGSVAGTFGGSGSYTEDSVTRDVNFVGTFGAFLD